MSGPIHAFSNKIGCRYSALSLRAGVHRAGGGGGAGENRRARCLGGSIEGGQVEAAPVARRIFVNVGNQALSGQRIGGVASRGVAWRGFLVRFQRLGRGGRLIASFATDALPGDLELADRRVQASAAGGLAPRPGAARDHLRGSPQQSSRANRSAIGGPIPPQSTLTAQQCPKNRESQFGTNGVGGCRFALDARKAQLRRRFLRSVARRALQIWGRGYANPADLGWRNPATLCAGVGRVN